MLSQALQTKFVPLHPPANDNGPDPGNGVSPSPSSRRGVTPAALSALDSYVRQLRRHPVLDAETQLAVARKFRLTKDPRLAGELVRANLRLVAKIAYEYRMSRKDLMDLIQEGNLGLLRAVYRFDPDRGVRLSSYAAWWIRAYMLKFILVNRRLVKIGTTQTQRRVFFNLNRQREHLQRSGQTADAGSIAAALAVPEQEVRDMEGRLASELSLESPVRDTDRSPRKLGDLIPDASSSRPDVRFENGEVGALLHEKLAAFSKTLQGRDAELFRDRLLSESPTKLVVIAERYAVTRQRVSQLEGRLRRKLRRFLEDELGTDACTLVTQR